MSGTQLVPAEETVAAEVRTLGEDSAEVLSPGCVFGKVAVITDRCPDVMCESDDTQA